MKVKLSDGQKKRIEALGDLRTANHLPKTIRKPIDSRLLDVPLSELRTEAGA